MSGTFQRKGRAFTVRLDVPPELSPEEVPFWLEARIGRADGPGPVFTNVSVSRVESARRYARRKGE